MRVRPKRSARFLKLQHTIAAVVPVLIVTLSITGFMWAQKEVTVVVDGRTVRVDTQADDVASVLDEAGVSVDHSDVVSPAPDEPLESGDTVVVRHSVPVTVDLGGDKVKVDVVGETVADAIVAAGADPSSATAVTPDLTRPLEAGMTIEAPNMYVRVMQEESTITPHVEEQRDSLLPKGERRVITAGEPGRVLRVYRVLVTNGIEGTPTLSAERVVERPGTTIVAVGTGVKHRSAGSAYRPVKVPKPPTGGRKMRVEATGYSPREPGLDFHTATGARAKRGVIAVDPRVIPLGTRVYIPGYGYAVARDTGGAIKGRRIDLCFDTVAECYRWGRRNVTIIILD